MTKEEYLEARIGILENALATLIQGEIDELDGMLVGAKIDFLEHLYGAAGMEPDKLKSKFRLER